MYQSQAAHQLGGKVALLGAERGASGEGDALTPVDTVAVAVGGDESRVPRRFDVVGDFVEHEVPRDALPSGRPRGAVQRGPDSTRRGRALHGGGALRAQAARVDWAVGVASDVGELRLPVAALARG